MSSPTSSGRLRWLGLSLAVALAVIAAIGVDASARRRAAQRTAQNRVAVARAFGIPDLVLSSTSRWLRHPSQSEPAAAFSDAPASLDTDPAGAVLGPPTSLFEQTARDTRIVRHRPGGRSPAR